MIMKKVMLFIPFLFLSFLGKAQIVYTTNNQFAADVIVYETNNQFAADWIIYK